MCTQPLMLLLALLPLSAFAQLKTNLRVGIGASTFHAHEPVMPFLRKAGYTIGLSFSGRAPLAGVFQANFEHKGARKGENDWDLNTTYLCGAGGVKYHITSIGLSCGGGGYYAFLLDKQFFADDQQLADDVSANFQRTDYGLWLGLDKAILPDVIFDKGEPAFGLFLHAQYGFKNLLERFQRNLGYTGRLRNVAVYGGIQLSFY